MKYKSASSFPLNQIRASTFVVLAYAVSKVFPGVELIGGSVDEYGFFYDFVTDKHLGKQALPLIEEQMRAIIKAKLPIKALEMMRKNAANFFEHHRQPLKAAFIETHSQNTVEMCQIEKFFEFCPSPYLPTTAEIGAFKLQDIQETQVTYPGIGELNVTRIYGTSFHDKDALKKFLKMSDAAKKNDHKILAQQMNLISFNDEVGVGAPIWQPKGVILRETLVNWLKKQLNPQAYQQIATPRLVKYELLENAGFNADSLVSLYPRFAIDEIDHVLTPLNAPLHAQYFRSEDRHIEELPLRVIECADVYCYEKSAHLSGLLRTKSAYTDNEHIFCTPSQVLEELISSLQFLNKTIIMLGFKHRCYLNARGSQFVGSREQWEKNELLLIKAFSACGLQDLITDAQQNTTEAACCGPRIDMRLVDVFDREWSGPFVGIDAIHPARLKLRYRDSEGVMQAPTMIAQSTYGALERFVAVLLEHYGGYLPLWLAPEQVRIIPIAASNAAYARAIGANLEQQGFRISVDSSQGKLGGKIHALEQEKVPYGIIVGEKEEKEGVITIRSCSQQEMRDRVRLETFLKELHEEVLSKTNITPS